MKNFTEIYRIFTRNFLIYMSPEGMDYRAPLQELIDRDKKPGDKKTKVETNAEKKDLIKGNKFAEKRKDVKDLIKKIDLDANPDKKTQKELDLEKEVNEHSDKQFDLLEHNYRLAVKELGSDEENEKGGIREAEDILYKSTDRFISKIEVHILKENANKGNPEAKALMIEQFLESRGIQAKGMGKHLVEALGSKLNLDDCKTEKAIEEKLEKILDNKDVLMQAVQKLINGLPKINNVTREKKDYFWNQMKDSENDGDNRLAAKFGDKNMGSATIVLAMRFHFNYETKDGREDKTKPQFIVDTTTNTVYKADSPEWKRELKRICHEELNNITNIRKQSEGLKKLGKERAGQQDELLNGKWWRTDLEVHKLGRLKDNPLLADVLRTSTDYQEATTREFNENSKKLAIGAERILSLAANLANRDSRPALEALASTLNPDKARDGNFMNALADLIKMIGEALSGKDPKYAKDTLGEMKTDIEAGKNPAAEQAKAKDIYKKIIEQAKPPISPDRLFTYYLNPTSATTNVFFTAEGSKIDKTEGQLIADKYKNERAPIIKKYLENQLGISALVIKTSDKGWALSFKLKDEPKGFYVKAVGNQLEVTNAETSKKQEVKNDFTALAQAFKYKESVVAQPKTTPPAPEKKEFKNTQYADKEGVLKNVGNKVKIQDVLSAKDFEEVTIKIDKPRQGFKKGAEIKVKQSGDTFVIAEGKNKEKRFLIYNGDKITDVKPKQTAAEAEPKKSKA